jgi:hypothetical protein
MCAEVQLGAQTLAVDDDALCSRPPRSGESVIQPSLWKKSSLGVPRMRLWVVNRQDGRNIRQQREHSRIGSLLGVDNVGVKGGDPLANDREPKCSRRVSDTARYYQSLSACPASDVENLLAFAHVFMKLQ